MNKLKSFFMKPASTSLSGVFLIFICVACACPRMDEKSSQRGSKANSSTPSIRSKSSNVAQNETIFVIEEDRVLDDASEIEESSSDSSSSYFIGTWKVTRANAYLPDYKPLTINRDRTYSWEEPVSKESFTGNWRMEGGLLIIEKAYKGADWSVKVFKPANQTSNSDQIWMNGIGDGMGFHEYKGFRPE